MWGDKEKIYIYQSHHVGNLTHKARKVPLKVNDLGIF